MHASVACGQRVSVRAEVEQDKVYVGEAFGYNVVVDGDDSEPVIDIGPLDKWSPRKAGVSPLSKTSITIVNGRQTQQTHKRIAVSYLLTATKVGRFYLPELNVMVNGQLYKTNRVTVEALQPVENDDLDLEVELSTDRAYVGQPVRMTIKWYFARNVGGYNFNLPFLDDNRFVIEDVVAVGAKRNELVKLSINGKEVIARKYNTNRATRAMTVIVFEMIVIPREEGVFEFAAPGVTCKLEKPRRSSRRRGNGFDSFFDDPFFGGTREYERVIATADDIMLTVVPLPKDGRPAAFSGLVGHYSISAGANPVAVSVGDPITLTVTINGDLLKGVESPDLAAIPDFANNFKIPSEQSVPKIANSKKIFTQTIRAKNADITEIPAIPLSCFDVDSGQYTTVWSEPVALKVAAKKIVTAADALGGGFVMGGRELQAIDVGIAANYDGPDLLDNTVFSLASALSSLWYIVLFGLGPVFFVVSASVRLAKRDNPARQCARRKARAKSKALTGLRHLQRNCRGGNNAEIMYQTLADILRRYVGDYYDKAAGALTTRDCEEILALDHDNATLVDEFCEILELCDHGRFGQSADTGDMVDFANVTGLIKRLDKSAKK